MVNLFYDEKVKINKSQYVAYYQNVTSGYIFQLIVTNHFLDQSILSNILNKIILYSLELKKFQIMLPKQ